MSEIYLSYRKLTLKSTQSSPENCLMPQISRFAFACFKVKLLKNILKETAE